MAWRMAKHGLEPLKPPSLWKIPELIEVLIGKSTRKGSFNRKIHYK
jgi:hypothetical protein